MADKAMSELIAANQVTPTDLFVLEQSGTAKKLTGQTLENWLCSLADGHGMIQNIEHIGSKELVDTYRITLADTTIFDFLVTNGRDVRSITKTGTSGLVDTYTIRYNDNTTDTLTVTNGEKGDKGDSQYVWIKYASQKPTASSHSFGDVADNWIGIYSGASASAPTDWTEYEWFQIKGEKGDTGYPARLISSAVDYQVSDSGTIIPSGAWSSSVPVVAQGKYLWTRTTTTFNTGSSVVSYSVSRMGMDGIGSVSSVSGVSPDSEGNVPLTAEHIGASKINTVSVTLYSYHWTDNEQTVNVADVTADETKTDVIAAPWHGEKNTVEYTTRNVRAIKQMDNCVTFKCDTVPTIDLAVNVMIKS